MTSAGTTNDHPFLKLGISFILAIGLLAGFVYLASIRASLDSYSKESGQLAFTDELYDELDQMQPSMLLHQGKKEEAAAAAKQLAQKDSYDVKALMAAGNVLSQIPASKKEGFELLQRSVYMAPASPQVRINFARMLTLSKQYEFATAEYNDLIKRFPALTAPRYELAQLYVALKEFDQAKQTLEPTRTNDVNNSHAQKEFGFVLALNNEPDDGGFIEFKSAVFREIGVGHPYEINALLAKYNNDPKDALAAVRGILANNPNDTSLKLQETQLLIADKNLDGAKAIIDKLAEDNKDNPEILLEQSELSLFRKDQTAAKSEFDKAVKLAQEGSAE